MTHKGKLKKPAFFIFFSLYYAMSGLILLYVLRETFRFNGFIVIMPIVIISGTGIAIVGNCLANWLGRRI
ncbi:hypothetical protein [Thaumasiovibrio subtropicus]|uniref:hypothetical protein n=1 Tax=Thaumasiovibrio subtropicus TaxID=1891207 RepID=UPI000B34B8EC|nr:hypothetical protein [Thaumasiovibrio subtropicus]